MFDPIVDTATLKQFLDLSNGTRSNFHEPDEQGIKYLGSVGTSLDNAFGNHVSVDAVKAGYQEVVLFFSKETAHETKTYSFNLATLLALAKCGAMNLQA